MNRDNLDRVTITGADDSTPIDWMLETSELYPFVEWGILVSHSRLGTPRFPSMNWMTDLHLHLVKSARSPLRISFHVCGHWVRQICSGKWSPLLDNVGPAILYGQRIQLNFHAYAHRLGGEFIENARARSREHKWQIIFQCDDVNDHLVSDAYDDGIDAVPLYDKSGGAGIVPESWPGAMKGIYSGYAGGLGVDTLEEELPAIAKAANGGRFWVDMETKVRTPDDRRLDPEEVLGCLKICEPFVRANGPGDSSGDKESPDA